MQVTNFLTAIRIAIDDQPVTALGDASLSRQVARKHNLPEEVERSIRVYIDELRRQLVDELIRFLAPGA